MCDPKNPDRPYAMLTRKDRNFLLSGGRGYNSDDKNNRKNSIIPRVRNSLIDFQLLATRLSEDWRRELSDITNPDEMDAFHEGLVNTIAFLYLLCTDKRGGGEYESGYRPAPFWEVLEAGISKVETAQYSDTEPRPVVDVTFDVEVHEPRDTDIENLVDRMACTTAASLSGAEARALLHAIDPKTDFYDDDYETVLNRLQSRQEEFENRRNHMVETGERPDEDTDN